MPTWRPKLSYPASTIGTCDVCNGATHDEVDARLLSFIRTTGWALQGVEPRPDRVGWVYTIGLAQSYHHPELITLDHDIRRAAQVLNTLGRAVRDGAVLDPSSSTVIGVLAVELVAVHPVHLSEAMATWHRLCVQVDGRRPDLVALQVRVPSMVTGPSCRGAVRRDLRIRLDQPYTRLPTG